MTTTTTVPHWLLFRLAPRAIAAVDRNKDVSPVLGAYQVTLKPVAEKFIQLYKRREADQSSLRVSTQQRRDALEKLRVTLRTWVAFLSSSMPGLEPGLLGDSPTIAEDLIADAESLLELAATNEAAGRGTPKGWDTLKADLTAAIAAARAEADGNSGSAVLLSLLRTELRDTARELQEQLVSFRQVLRMTYGPSHPDLIRLRVAKTNSLIIEGDELSDEEVQEVEAALSGSNNSASPISSSAPATGSDTSSVA